MKLLVITLCLVGMTTAALAQYGVSNARDGNGNLIRDNGLNRQRDLNQPPVNNLNGSTVPRFTASQKPTTAKESSK